MLPAREVAAPSELQAAEAESGKVAAWVQPAASALRALSLQAEAAGVACVQAAQPREAAGSGARVQPPEVAVAASDVAAEPQQEAVAAEPDAVLQPGEAAAEAARAVEALRPGWWRRRSGTRRCSGWRRRRRWCLGCGGRRRSARRWPPGFAVRAYLFLGLGHDERCGLRMRCGGRELRYRQSRCGKQHDAKVCHDVLGPRKTPGSNEFAFIGILDDSQRVIIRPDCGRLQMARWFLFHRRNGLHVPLFIACSDRGFNAGLSGSQIGSWIGCTGTIRPAHR